MKKCIGLIAGSSGDALTDELHNKGYEVALLCGRPGEPGSNATDFVLISDLSEHQRIINFFRSHKVEFIIIGTGHIKAIELSKVLASNGFITNINYEKSILAKDKVLFKRALEKIGIVTPEYISFIGEYNIDDIVQNIGIPCVVKSATDALQPVQANSLEEIRRAAQAVLATNTELLVERYIDGSDYTVAVASDGESTRNLGVIYYSKAKEYGLIGFENAHTRHLSTEDERIFANIALKVVSELRFEGLVRVDFIANNRIYVLELNSVIITGYNGGLRPFAQRQGIDIGKVMIETSLHICENKQKKQKVYMNETIQISQKVEK